MAVTRFIEKPNAATAERGAVLYLGEYDIVWFKDNFGRQNNKSWI